MKTLKQVREQMTTAGIAGLPPDLPPVPAGVTTAMTGNLIRRKKPLNSFKEYSSGSNK